MRHALVSPTLISALLASTGCAPTSTLLVGTTPKQFEPRQLIVTLSEDVRSQWPAIHQEILNQFDVTATGEFPLKSIRANCLVYRVSDMVDVGEIKRRLGQDQRIELVQDNQVFDSLAGQRGAGGANAYLALSYGPKLTHADLVHSTSTGKGVSIAVVDTGADPAHPDLQGHVSVGDNFVEGGKASFAEDKHGTAVAGVIAAQAGNGIGIDGIAPDADINIYKACWYADNGQDKALCSSWTLAKAIDAAILKGDDIINLSLGGKADPLLKQLLDKANQHHIVLVAAALENRPEPGFPASLDFVIPVISADPKGKTATPQWRRPLAAIAAPGVEILTTAPDNRYDFVSGSSLAAAHVSGIAALLLQYKPGLHPEAIKAAMHRSGQPQGKPGPAGQTPLIDACRALLSVGAALDCQ